MTSIWNKLGLIDNEQHAFVNSGSTTEPALLKKLVIEDARLKVQRSRNHGYYRIKSLGPVLILAITSRLLAM